MQTEFALFILPFFSMWFDETKTFTSIICNKRIETYQTQRVLDGNNSNEVIFKDQHPCFYENEEIRKALYIIST